MLCLKCWYYHYIKCKLWYPLKARVLRSFRRKHQNQIILKSAVIAELYDGPIQEGKLIKRIYGSNKIQDWGCMQIREFMTGLTSTSGRIGAMLLGTLCSDTSFGEITGSSMSTDNYSKLNTYYYAQFISIWGTTGLISNICQAAIKQLPTAELFGIYNFGTAFSKEDGQSLKITWNSTIIPG